MSTIRPGEVTRDQNQLGLRDAFHVAGIAVVAMQPIDPGDFIVIREGSKAFPSLRTGAHAVADPWFEDPIKTGTIFLAFPMPGMVKNIRHNFETEFDKKPAEKVVVEEDEDEEEDEYDDDGCRGCYDG